MELRGTAALDKMRGRVQHPADAPTRVSDPFSKAFCLAYCLPQSRLCIYMTAVNT